MNIKILFSIFMLAFVFGSLAQADQVFRGVEVQEAWVQAVPASQKTTAAYITIWNASLKDIVLTSVSSSFASIVEIHQMSSQNGMMTMRKVSEIRIPAQSKVALQPGGGFHLMLINLKKPLHKGDIVDITLHYKDGSSTINAVNAIVKMERNEDEGMSGMKM
jgi:copper(I)-binding protein